MKKLLASLLVFGVVTSNMVMAVKPASKATPVVTSAIAKIVKNLKAQKATYAELCTKKPVTETENEQLRIDKIKCEREIAQLNAQLKKAITHVDMEFNSNAYAFSETESIWNNARP